MACRPRGFCQRRRPDDMYMPTVYGRATLTLIPWSQYSAEPTARNPTPRWQIVPMQIVPMGTFYHPFGDACEAFPP